MVWPGEVAIESEKCSHFVADTKPISGRERVGLPAGDTTPIWAQENGRGELAMEGKDSDKIR